MPTYVYECAKHGRREVEKPMALASAPLYCVACAEENLAAGRWEMPAPMRRIYAAAGIIMRPDGWSLRPGDKGYWNFDRQRELGQLRDGGANADKKRLDASLFARPAPPKVTYTDKQMREIRNFSEIVDREIRASSDIPELIREGS